MFMFIGVVDGGSIHMHGFLVMGVCARDKMRRVFIVGDKNYIITLIIDGMWMDT